MIKNSTKAITLYEVQNLQPTKAHTTKATQSEFTYVCHMNLVVNSSSGSPVTQWYLYARNWQVVGLTPIWRTSILS